MTIFSYIIGTAGSGKSTLGSFFLDWLRESDDELNVITVNLDPGVKWLPYAPDVDCRDYIDINDIMLKYNLGPNGALIASIDLLVTKINEIKENIEDFRPDHVIIDTPGQIELFAFRSSGNLFVSSIDPKSSVLIYLLDPNLSRSPSGYISTLLLGASIQYRFFIPQIQVLSKADILSKLELEKLLKWSEDYNELETALNQTAKGMRKEMSLKIYQTLSELGSLHQLIPVSGITGLGMDVLYAEISRVLSAGEDFYESY
ncbi:MAG: ATP/GTP-binding protein [Candidatus Helarchaeota archaeon]